MASKFGGDPVGFLRNILKYLIDVLQLCDELNRDAHIVIPDEGNMLILVAQFVIERAKPDDVALLSGRLVFVVIPFRDKTLDRYG